MPMRKNMQEYKRFKDPSGQNKEPGWKKNPTQHTGISPDETQGVLGREAHHSTQSLQAEVTETRTEFRKIK